MGKLIQIIFPILFLCVYAGSAWAGEGHEPRWGDFGWRVLNLLLFCGILWYFVGGLCKRFFRDRRQNIQDTLTELEKRREDAKANLAEIERRIANLEAERKAILDESRQQAERLKKGIVDDANRQASQILDQARRAADNEGRAMLEQLRSTVADEIIEATSKALAGKLTADDHDKLIANSLDKVALQ